jgi:phosphate transport system substrate-binding protein
VKVSLVTRTAGLAAVAAIGLAACGSSSSGGNPGSNSGTTSLSPQGSTFQAAIEEQWAANYHNSHSSAQITYTPNGSSDGIAAFDAGKVAYAGSDVTMTSQEQQAATAKCGSPALTLPITSGGVAIMYNLPGITNLQLSAPTLAGIYQGTITNWNDAAIKADNPTITNLPDQQITAVYRGDGSGTTAVLSGFLDATAPSVWKLGVDKELSWPKASTLQPETGSSDVASTVKSTTGGIGYAEITYAKQDSLPTAAIKGAKGGFQTISSASVAKSIKSGFAITGTSPDLAGALSFTKMTGYPISTVSYVLVCSKYSDAATGALVKNYLAYAAGAGQSLASGLGFAPLPSTLDQKVLSSIATIS